MIAVNRKWEKSLLTCFSAMFVSLLFLLAGTASAHVEDWSEPGYNFNAIKKMLVYDLDISAVNLETDIAEKNFQSAFWEQAKKQKIEIINLKRAENQVSLAEYKDIDALRIKDPAAAEEMWKNTLPRVVDAYAKTQYLQYEYTSRVIPAHTEWRTRWVRHTYYDHKGRKHEESYPEEYPEYVPEKTIWTLHQRVRFDVYDAKTNKCIYSRNEARSDDYAGDGKNIFVKIVRNSFKDFLKRQK